MRENSTDFVLVDRLDDGNTEICTKGSEVRDEQQKPYGAAHSGLYEVDFAGCKQRSYLRPESGV